MFKFIGLFILLGFSQAGFAAEALKTVILNTIEVPPFFSESKPEQGAAAFAMREQLKKQGYNLEFHFMPFGRAKVEALKNVDVMGFTPCSETDLVRGFVMAKPLLESTTVLIQRKANPIVWNSPQDLKKYKAGHVIGYSMKGPLNQEKLTVEATSDDVANLLKLGNKHIDFVMITDAMFKYLMKTDARLRPYSDQLEMNSKSVTKVHWSIAFKTTPRGRAMMEVVNAKMDPVEFQKSIQAYLQKYK